MNYNCYEKTKYHGNHPYVTNIKQSATQNTNFRTAIWTGDYLQMTLMHIPVCEQVGLEIHKDMDQFIRVEQGNALVKMGECKKCMDFEQYIYPGDGIFIPADTWHNIINVGNCPLKLSSIYAPPHHPKGTVNRTKPEDY